MRPALDTWTTNIHREDVRAVLDAVAAHLNGRRTRDDAHYRSRNRNGRYVWVHDCGKVCARDANGSITRMVGIMVQDVTQKRLGRAEREHHQHNLQNLVAERLVAERTAALSIAKAAAEAANRANSSVLATLRHALRTTAIQLGGLMEALVQLIAQRAAAQGQVLALDFQTRSRSKWF